MLVRFALPSLKMLRWQGVEDTANFQYPSPGHGLNGMSLASEAEATSGVAPFLR